MNIYFTAHFAHCLLKINKNRPQIAYKQVDRQLKKNNKNNINNDHKLFNKWNKCKMREEKKQIRRKIT